MHPGSLPSGRHTDSAQTCEDPAYATKELLSWSLSDPVPRLFPFPSLEVHALNRRYFLVYIVVSPEQRKGGAGEGDRSFFSTLPQTGTPIQARAPVPIPAY